MYHAAKNVVDDTGVFVAVSLGVALGVFLGGFLLAIITVNRFTSSLIMPNILA